MNQGASPEPDHRLTDDRMVTPERSVFGTRLPRPTGVGRHLMIVIAFSIIALVVAIAFAERDTAERDAAAARGSVNDDTASHAESDEKGATQDAAQDDKSDAVKKDKKRASAKKSKSKKKR